MPSMKILWLLIYFTILIWSAIAPKDTFTWFLEVLPAFFGLIILLATYRQFRLSRFTYLLILIHCVILMVGGHYTYAEVPLFDTFSQWFGWQRNNYDKAGHFAQGFIPAAIAYELLLRLKVVNGTIWRCVLVVAFCLAFSAFYELIEWWVALATGEDAEAFLGTQGDIWDTQSDMMWALMGAACFILFFRGWQQREINRLHQSADSQTDL